MRALPGNVLACCLLTLVACTSPPPASGQLVVDQQRVEPLGGVFIEGAIAFLEVRDSGGQVAYETRTPQYLEAIRLGAVELPPGSYQLRSYVRSCSGNCGFLDPPTDECATGLEIEAGGTYQLLIQRDVGSPCRIVKVP